jgi:hypothetical protein
MGIKIIEETGILMRSFNMKRKLVEYEVFEKMRENSLTKAVKELIEAEEHLARALDVDGLKMSSFNKSTVIYETTNGSYIRANFTVDDKKVSFDDIEELVIDEDSQREKSRSILKNMLEAILDDNEVEANSLFEKYMAIQSKNHKRESVEAQNDGVLHEGYARLYGSPERTKGKSAPVISYRAGGKDPVKVRAAKTGHARNKASYLKGARKRKRNKTKEQARRKHYNREYGKLRALNAGKHYTGKRKKMTEWFNLSENVYGYIDFVENGHIVNETKVIDQNGTLSITMPNSQQRNEGKVLKMHFDNMLKTDVKVLRENARRLVQDPKFCQMVADVKRYNNISDNKELEESIGNLVGKYPSVLYLTQEELARTIALALDSTGVTNYDDQTCTFMSEGILRVAHESYSDRVDRIKRLAKSDLKESDDKYLDFQKIISDFFPTLDESTQIEMKMFEDLYNVAVDIRRIALESNNDVVRSEATDFIQELELVLKGSSLPSLDLAADVADWLENMAESNLPGAGETMDVVKKPHLTMTGDHPQMAKNAKVPGHPAAYGDDYGDPAPMIGADSNAWNHGDEARNRALGNKGGKDVWPDLSNPLTPKPYGDWKMKGEKSVVDDDDGFGTWQSADTWPQMTNPYLLPSLIAKQKVQPDNAVEPSK